MQLKDANSRVRHEVVRNLEEPRRKRPHAHGDMARLLSAIKKSFPDAFVDGYQSLIPCMDVALEDRHVAAMAVRAGAQVLVTYNRKHLPSAALASYGIDVQSPDEFLYNLYLHSPLTMVEAVRDQVTALTNPPKTLGEILDAFDVVHVRRFAPAIRTHLSLFNTCEVAMTLVNPE